MKLYLSDLNLSNIKIDNIEKYITSKDIIIELYSNEGIFVCKNHTGFKKLDIIDGDVKIIENYIEQLNLYIDETFIYKSKQLASRIPVNNKRKLLTKYEFKQSSNSPVTLVIEQENKITTNLYFMMVNNHGKYSIADINNQFTKETIQFFLELIRF